MATKPAKKPTGAEAVQKISQQIATQQASQLSRQLERSFEPSVVSQTAPNPDAWAHTSGGRPRTWTQRLEDSALGAITGSPASLDKKRVTVTGPDGNPLEVAEASLLNTQNKVTGAGLKPSQSNTEHPDNPLAAFASSIAGLGKKGLGAGGWALEQISRPSAAVMEGLNRAGEANLTGNDPIWRTIDDLAKGMGSGFTDPTHARSYGNFVEQAAQSNENTWMTGHGLLGLLKENEQEKSRDIKWGSPSTWGNFLSPKRTAKNLLSLTGEIMLDPTTYVSLGVTDAIKPFTQAGKVAATDAAKSVSQQIADQVVAKAVSSAGNTKNLDKLMQNAVDVQRGASRGTKPLNPKVVESAAKQVTAEKVDEIIQDGMNMMNRAKRGVSPIPAGKAHWNKVWHDVVDDMTNWTQSNIGAAKMMTKSQIDAKWDEFMNLRVREFALDRAGSIQKGIQDAWNPLLQRRFDLRLGPLGHGASLGHGSISDAIRKVTGLELKGITDRAFTAAYRPVEWAGGRVRESNWMQHTLKAFSYGDNFPGLTSRIRQATKASGVRSYNLFRRGAQSEIEPLIINQGLGQAPKVIPLQSMDEVFRGVRKAEREHIYEAMQKGNRAVGVTKSGRALSDVQTQIENWLEKFAQERIDAGLMDATQKVTDFTPIYFGRVRNKEAKELVNRLKAARKSEAHTTGRITANTADELKRLHPELPINRDIRDVMLFYGAKHQRDMVRDWFRQEMVNAYGIIPNTATPKNVGDFIKGLKTKAVPSDYLPGNLKHLTDKILMDPEVMKVFKNFEDLWHLSDTGLDEIRTIGHYFDTVNRWWKMSATVLRPAFQLRNFIGDIFTGYLDQIPGWAYTRWAKAKLRGAGSTVFEVGGRKYSYGELRERFLREEGASTFYNVEGITPGENPVKAALNKIRDFSEARENFPREVHFAWALKQEMEARTKGLLKGKPKGYILPKGTLDRIEEQALTAARARVNKFKFDYSALTPFESQYVKRVVPFYTFMKKAVPLMLETTLFTPARLNAFNKAQQALGRQMGMDYADENYQQQYDMSIPSWARDMGVVPLENLDPSTGENVTGLNFSSLPQSTLPELFAGGTNQALFQNLVSQINPIARMPFELAAGKQLRTNAPVGIDAGSLTSYIPFLDNISRNLPMGETKVGPLTIGSDKPGVNKVAGITGLPLYEFSNAQRINEVKNQQDAMERQVHSINQKLEGSGMQVRAVNTSAGTIYRVTGTELGPDGRYPVLHENPNPGLAYQWAVTRASTKTG